MTNRYIGRALFLVAVWPMLLQSCGDDGRCKKSGPACTDQAMPSVPEGEAFAAVSGLEGGDSLHAYGSGNTFWSTDGKGISIYMRDPFFTQSIPRPVAVRLDLFRDADGDAPACYVGDHSFPLCFDLGDAGGGLATLEDDPDSSPKIYVTEGGAKGRVFLLGFDKNGMLTGRFDFVGYFKVAGSTNPSAKVTVSNGTFALPRGGG